jgi:polyisoprenoid-binding protein YceI
MKRLASHLVYATLIVGLPLAAAETTVDLDPIHTSVSFTVADPLHTVHGNFRLKHGLLKLDPVTGKASGIIAVDVTSGDSGSQSRDKRMHRDILESAHFPEAVFTPDRYTGDLLATGESHLDIHGVFQIHGASHEVTFHFHVVAHDGSLVASTNFQVPYVQWGMKSPSNFLLKVSDKVEMTVQATGHMH